MATAGRDKAHPPRFYCLNPDTQKFDEVFPESEIADTKLVIPMFWTGKMYCTVPGTEFYGHVPDDF
jgi:hypothetical protein